MKRKELFLLELLVIASIIFASSPAVGQQQNAALGIEVGNKAPDIIEKSVDGNELRLSDLKGKYVLIDFWASWCSPCRRENPTVVNAYNKYKDKKFNGGNGFTVFSVSLDRSKDSWVNAIKADKLDWPNHVSDLKYWQSKQAMIYRVNSIPANFLINGDGIIVAKNLRGPRLEAALEALSK
ncbi:MAG: TlpA family protein disulfide reductase [Prolixibacteraceae bacterium]|nr:TlpA family protein disulfide reductase [Prolixibacteraceae bacterium]MBN2773055.1 TlpA family protein disulfide reductase [Prolixibacteraceae bacterium]